MSRLVRFSPNFAKNLDPPNAFRASSKPVRRAPRPAPQPDETVPEPERRRSCGRGWRRSVHLRTVHRLDFRFVDGYDAVERGRASSRCQKALQTPTPDSTETLQYLRKWSAVPKAAAEQGFSSRRPDSNRGPLHYELWAPVASSHRQTPQALCCAESSGLKVTLGDPR
jgi:hypothetical protein